MTSTLNILIIVTAHTDIFFEKDYFMTSKHLFLTAIFCLSVCGLASGSETIQLPEPTKSGGVTLADALRERHSSREFANVDLNAQQLSDLLWSTGGANRPDGKKVYAVARNRHDMTVYAITRQGIHRYDPAAHALILIAAGDYRAQTGTQPYVGGAAVNLAYVQDMGMWPGEPEAGKELGFAHTGEMVQNAYLYAAGQGWSAVVRGMFDKDGMKKLLQLPDGHFVRLVQSVGPKP